MTGVGEVVRQGGEDGGVVLDHGGRAGVQGQLAQPEDGVVPDVFVLVVHESHKQLRGKREREKNL